MDLLRAKGFCCAPEGSQYLTTYIKDRSVALVKIRSKIRGFIRKALRISMSINKTTYLLLFGTLKSPRRRIKDVLVSRQLLQCVLFCGACITPTYYDSALLTSAFIVPPPCRLAASCFPPSSLLFCGRKWKKRTSDLKALTVIVYRLGLGFRVLRAEPKA